MHDTPGWTGFLDAVMAASQRFGLARRSRRGPLPDDDKRGVLEDHPRLDMRALAKAGYCTPGERRFGVIDRSGFSPLIETLRFVVDLTELSAPWSDPLGVIHLK